MNLSKSRINLKYKDIDGGRKSIYLDYYKDGKRVRESLRLYLLPETSRKTAAGNKAVMRKAEEIRRSRIEELTAGENGIEIDAAMPDIPLAKVIKDYHTLILERGINPQRAISWGCIGRLWLFEARMSCCRLLMWNIATVLWISCAMSTTASTANSR